MSRIKSRQETLDLPAVEYPIPDYANTFWYSLGGIIRRRVGVDHECKPQGNFFSALCFAIMREKKYGKTVNMASSAGRSTSELGGAHYTASKAAVLGLTRHTAREYGSYGMM